MLALLVPLWLIGMGNGTFMVPNMNLSVSSVESKEAGVASGLLGTAQRIGTSLGIALVGAVLVGPSAVAAALA